VVSQYDRNPRIDNVSVDDGFDDFHADLFVPHSANGGRQRKLELRPFVFVDGEGVNHTENGAQSYVLFGASSGERIKGYDLSTLQMFNFLIKLKKTHMDGLFVGFALNYDVNMICRDIPVELLMGRIRKAKRTQWKHYTIHYMPSKKFSITDREQGITFTMSDVFTFFGCSFVVACEQYLGEYDPRLVRVREGKALRNVFEYSELDTLIEPYMSLELELGTELVERLRFYLMEAGIKPRGWHGPGAVAAALLSKERITSSMKVPDSNLVEWSRRAYFGGRFEQMRTGYYNGKVWQYDIRSAYPYALTHCPDLSSGNWTLRKQPSSNVQPFSLYAMRFRNKDARFTDWNPIPLRSNRQTIHYQAGVDGIYWGPEASLLLEHYPGNVELLGVLEYEDTGERPFAFVEDMYNQRAEWKDKGNPAQLALKLGMNSLYGKLAQRVGWNEEKMCAPPSHQLEWAGFVTSMCRAKMLELMLQSPESIIAIETDGIFTSKPLACDVGPRLGQMEMDEWDGIIYIQSGVYFKRSDTQWVTSKTRGFAKNTLTVADDNRAKSICWDGVCGLGEMEEISPT
jgi:hypothetical protein